MSEGNRPRLRAVVLDAREPVSSTRDAAGMLRERSEPIPLPGARAHTPVDVRFGFLHGVGTFDLVTAALGVDVIVITAGPRIAHIARNARILRAAGARAAVISLPAARRDPFAPPSIAADLTSGEESGVDVERNVRHLLTGIGLSGDDAVAVPSDQLVEAVSRAVTPRAADGFLVVGVAHHRGGRIEARMIAGAMPKGTTKAFVLGVDGFEARDVQRVNEGDESFLLSIGPHAFGVNDQVVVSSEPLVCARRFVATSPSARAIGAEPCAAFGGNGGFAKGTIRNGVIDLERAVCPRDGRLGLILFKGAGLGPVSSIDALPIAAVRALPRDEDELYELAKAAIKEQVVATYGPWDEAWQRARFHETFRPVDVDVYRDERGVFALLDVHDVVRASGEHGVADALYVSRVYVHPRAQGCGVGSLLVRTAMERARELGVDVALRVLHANARARTLYERLGFVVTSSDDKHVTMRASLAAPPSRAQGAGAT